MAGNKGKSLRREVIDQGFLLDTLQSVLESSMNGIIGFNPISVNKQIVDLQPVVINGRAAEIIGMSKEEILNSTLLTFNPGNKDAGIFDKYVEVIRSGTPFRFVQEYVADGIQGWFDISAVPNGEGLVVTFTDVSDAVHRQRTLEEKQEELERVNKELEQFVYIASHDLQEPLRKVRSFGDRLSQMIAGHENERARDYVRRMQNAAGRMQRLIEDLLKFSRVSRKERIEFQQVKMNDVLREVLDNMSDTIKRTEAEIHIPDLPEIRANRTQMIQLMQNLISNGIKYAKPGERAVVVLTYKDEMKYHLFEVKDEGIGFDQAYADKIFKIFERLHGRHVYEGTGIGLAICERIVENHHGSIRAESQPEEGAKFTVSIPKKL